MKGPYRIVAAAFAFAEATMQRISFGCWLAAVELELCDARGHGVGVGIGVVVAARTAAAAPAAARRRRRRGCHQKGLLLLLLRHTAVLSIDQSPMYA